MRNERAPPFASRPSSSAEEGQVLLDGLPGRGDPLAEERLLRRVERRAVDLCEQGIAKHFQCTPVLQDGETGVLERRRSQAGPGRGVVGGHPGEADQHVPEPFLEGGVRGVELAREAIGDVVGGGLPLPGSKRLDVPATRLEPVSEKRQVHPVRQAQAGGVEAGQGGLRAIDEGDLRGARRAIRHGEGVGVAIVAGGERPLGIQLPVGLQRLLDDACEADVLGGRSRDRRGGGGASGSEDRSGQDQRREHGHGSF